MKDDIRFSNDLAHRHLSGGAPLQPAPVPASTLVDKRPGLDEHFPWHRIRRMSRK